MGTVELFISWSGEGSRQAAEALASFLEHVVSGASTFLSTHDIEAGERWEGRLTAELRAQNAVILCLTRDNQRAPWINYEAGAIGNSPVRPRVIPYTIGFAPNEIHVGPLSRFQGVRNDEAGTWKLVWTLSQLSASPKDESFVREGFQMFWPKLRDAMTGAEAQGPAESAQLGPSDRELLLELRQHVKTLLDFATAGSLRIGAAIDVVQDAVRDPLTGLPNTRAFMQRTQHLALSGAVYVIAVIGVDGFKRINDAYGHHVGDRVLASVASSLKETLTSADIIARYAGDEFVASFRAVTPGNAEKDLLKACLHIPEAVKTAGLPEVTISVGVSDGGLESLEEKLRDADRAMYEAKKQGGGTVKCAALRDD